jgi:putative lipoprotein
VSEGARLHVAGTPPIMPGVRTTNTAIRRLRLLAACLVWTAAAPAAAQDDWLGRDKALHFGVSAAIAASAYGVSAIWLEQPAWRALAGTSTALAAGAVKELWDAAGHGDPSGKDFTWDLLGAVTGAGFALGVDLLVRHVRKKRGAEPAPAARAPPFRPFARSEPRYCPSRLSASSNSSASSLSRSPISTTE